MGNGAGAKYLILPPGYDGEIPDGYKVIRSRTYLQNYLFHSIYTACHVPTAGRKSQKLYF
jgi:hypothetical protein